MTTTVTAPCPYAVTLDQTGGSSLSDIVGVLTALGTLGAVVVAVWIALASARSARMEAARAHRRSTIRVVADWLGDLDSAEARLGTINNPGLPAPVMLAVDQAVKTAPQTARQLHALIQSTLRDPETVIAAMDALPAEAAKIGETYWANAIRIAPAGQADSTPRKKAHHQDVFPVTYHRHREALLAALKAEDQ